MSCWLWEQHAFCWNSYLQGHRRNVTHLSACSHSLLRYRSVKQHHTPLMCHDTPLWHLLAPTHRTLFLNNLSTQIKQMKRLFWRKAWIFGKSQVHVCFHQFVAQMESRSNVKCLSNKPVSSRYNLTVLTDWTFSRRATLCFWKQKGKTSGSPKTPKLFGQTVCAKQQKKNWSNRNCCQLAPFQTSRYSRQTPCRTSPHAVAGQIVLSRPPCRQELIPYPSYFPHCYSYGYHRHQQHCQSKLPVELWEPHNCCVHLKNVKWMQCLQEKANKSLQFVLQKRCTKGVFCLFSSP